MFQLVVVRPMYIHTYIYVCVCVRVRMYVYIYICIYTISTQCLTRSSTASIQSWLTRLHRRVCVHYEYRITY